MTSSFRQCRFSSERPDVDPDEKRQQHEDDIFKRVDCIMKSYNYSEQTEGLGTDSVPTISDHTSRSRERRKEAMHRVRLLDMSRAQDL